LPIPNSQLLILCPLSSVNSFAAGFRSPAAWESTGNGELKPGDPINRDTTGKATVNRGDRLFIQVIPFFLLTHLLKFPTKKTLHLPEIVDAEFSGLTSAKVEIEDEMMR
jgi:hypothetical protein